MSYRSVLSALQLARRAVLRVPRPVVAFARASPSPTHHAYDALHAQTLKSLSLVPHPTGPNSTWRHDVLRAVGQSGLGSRATATASWMLEGKLATMSTGEQVRQGLTSVTGGLESPTERDELIALVLATLDLRAMERTFLEPSARSLRRTLRLFSDGLLDSPIPPSSRIPTPPSRPSSPTPTAEQYAIIDSPSTPGVTRINAYAGTGKTTALVKFSEQLYRQNPQVRILYVAFNRSVKVAATLAFAHLRHNVTCRTINSITYQYLIGHYGRQTIYAKTFEGGARGTFRKLEPELVVELLGLVDTSYVVPATGELEILKGRIIAKRILKSLDRFAGTPSSTVELHHMIKSASYRPEIPPEDLLYWTRALWERVTDLADPTVPFPMSLHVNFCLQDPDFRLGTHEVVMFDEVQDSSDADLEMVLREAPRARVVLNGDRYQAIYQWRGATNRWTMVPAECDLRLSQSHRFGTTIANLASDILLLRDEHLPLSATATASPAIIYRPDLLSATVAGASGRTLICRSNFGLLHALLQHTLSVDLDESAPLPLLDIRTSRIWPETFNLYLHAHFLALGIEGLDPRRRSSSRLARFQTWDDLEAEVTELADEGSDLWPEELELVFIVDHKGLLAQKDFAEKWERVRLSVVDSKAADEDRKADVVLAVTHQIKGLEFDHITLADDFKLPDDLPQKLKSKDQSVRTSAEEAVSLLYVALTRARKSIILNRTTLRVLLAHQGLHQFELEQSSDEPCHRCRINPARIHYSTPFPPFPHHAHASPTPTTPICSKCASEAIYSPLKSLAEFSTQIQSEKLLKGSFDAAVEELSAAGPKSGPPFSSFQRACRDTTLYDAKIEAEMDQSADFWGGAAGAKETVAGLWNTVKPQRKVHSLDDYAHSFFMKQNRRFRLGVDATLLVVRALSTTFDSHQDETTNLPLKSLMFGLVKCQAAGMDVLLVFDGPKTPPTKRGRSTAGFGHGSKAETQLRELALSLGIASRRAAGEAEAELAVLCSDGHVDGVLSKDGDALMFGAPLLVSNFSTAKITETDKLKKEAISITTSKAIKLLSTANADLPIATYTLANLSLKQADMVLFAVLIGGDYDTKGLKGCGEKVALALVGMGEGVKLRAAYEAAKASPTPEVILTQWRNAVADVVSNGLVETTIKGDVLKKHPKLVETLRAAVDYPSFDVLNYYFDPAVYRLSANSSINLNLPIKFESIITSMNVQHHWPSWRCQAHFHARLLPSFVLRDLHLAATSRTTPPPHIFLEPLPTASNQIRIQAGRPDTVNATFKCPSYGASLVAAGASLSPTWERERNITHIVNGTKRNHHDPHPITDLALVKMHVPVELLERVYPAQIADWRARSAEAARKKAKSGPVAGPSKAASKDPRRAAPVAVPSTPRAKADSTRSSCDTGTLAMNLARIKTAIPSNSKLKSTAIEIDSDSDEELLSIDELLNARAATVASKGSLGARTGQQSSQNIRATERARGLGGSGKESKKRPRSADGDIDAVVAGPPPGERPKARQRANSVIVITSSPGQKVTEVITLLDSDDEAVCAAG